MFTAGYVDRAEVRQAAVLPDARAVTCESCGKHMDIAGGEGPAVTPADRDEAAPAARLDRAPGHPWGGDAARTTTPGIAAQAMSVPSAFAEGTAAHPVSREADAGPAAGHDEADEAVA